MRNACRLGVPAQDPGQVVVLSLVFAARTEQRRMADRSVITPVEGGDAAGQEFYLHMG